MAVAVPVSPLDQHSPRLGHRASSQTVWSFSSRSLAECLEERRGGGDEAGGRPGQGLGTPRCRQPCMAAAAAAVGEASGVREDGAGASVCLCGGQADLAINTRDGAHPPRV